jgi:pimeloyl-ACP methyl ester carboxylesterase
MLSGQTIFFLPGMDGTGISFEPVQGRLARDVQTKVVRYPNDRLLSFEETVRWAGSQLPLDQRNSIVIAESFSGPVAVSLLASGRVKAKCLVLCATFASAPRPRLWRTLSYLPLAWLTKPPLPRILLQWVIEGGKETVDLFLAMWGRVKAQVPAKVLAHRLRIMSRVDVRVWLPKIAVPCLYLQATRDMSVPASALLDFSQQVPDLRVRRIKGPHFILQARPRECLAAIEDFLNTL